jgi:2-keto-4-pentenoate hydratase/2-oxohepta-3-ene-1,7-dioic acid hydratase in catechol pathway
MRICRFDDNRIGVIDADTVCDVSAVKDMLPQLSWPFPCQDQFFANFEKIRPRMEALVTCGERRPLSSIRLLSPVANPGRIIGIGQSYMDHVAEARLDPILKQQVAERHDQIRMFIKSSAALVGPSEGVALRFLHERNDPELELAIVIGRRCEGVSPEEAPRHIAGYTMGLDMTLRGATPPSGRKSIDSYAVVGPWLVTADELPNANSLFMTLTVNGEIRQRANTKNLLFSLETIVAHASTFYTLNPGDVIMTGTPAGVAAIKPDDVIVAEIEGIGQMTVPIRAYRKRSVVLSAENGD